VATEFDLRGCQQAITATETDLAQLASELTDPQFHAPPRSGGWSVAFCIEHLVLTGHKFLSVWETAIKAAGVGSHRSNGRPRYHWWDRLLLHLTEPPYRLKTNSPQAFLPFSRHSKHETIHRFLNMHREVARCLESCGGVDPGRTRVQSPFGEWLS